MKLIFSEVNEKVKRLQVLREATIYDHRYGEVKITKEDIEKMVLNFNEKVRGIEIFLDAGHESDRESYGWFKKLSTQLGEDNKLELWADVEMTSLGERALSEKLFGYLSADFDLDYQDNETLKKHGPVLLGAGLTNRPVVKKMKSAIELAEDNNNNGVKRMNELEELLKELGLASKEELVKLIADLRSKIDLSEGEKKEMQDKMELAEKTNKFNIMLSEGKVAEAQRASYLKNDMEEFVKNAAKIKLSEITDGNGEADETSAEDKVLKLAEEKVKTEKLTLQKAITVVLSENKELSKKYRGE